MDKINVLFVIGSMHGGGAERAMLYLLEHLDSNKYKKTLLLFKKNGHYLNEVPGDIKILEVNGSNFFRRLLSLKKHVDNVHPQVILSMLDTPNKYLLRLKLIFGLNPKLIVVEQNNLIKNVELKYHGLKRALIFKEMRILYRLADKIICVSKGISMSMQEKLLTTHEKFVIINNPVDLTKIEAKVQEATPLLVSNTDKNIVCVGRFVPQKNQSNLIRVMSKIVESINCKLILLGDGPDKGKIEKLIKELNLEKHVQLFGFVDNPWSIIAKCDLFVSTSEWEGFPLGHIEALASGTPIITTDCPYGPDEIVIPDDNGYLCKIGDLDDMAQKIIATLSNKNKLEKLTVNASKNLEKFNVSPFIDKFDYVISSLK